MALRLVATLAAVSLAGSLPLRGEQCEPTTSSCGDAQSHAMNCCQSTHSCCDLSRPQSVPNSLPARTTTITGHEILKVASLPVDAMVLVDSEYLHVRSTAKADSSQHNTAGSYLLTHAFLI